MPRLTAKDFPQELLDYYDGIRINEGPAYEEALKANKRVYEAYIYPGVNHGFHNDSTPRYDKTAADLSWKRTLTWFNGYLRYKTKDY